MRKSQTPKNIKTCDMDISVRLWNVLCSKNIRTLGKMLKYSLADYAKMDNIGKVTIEELKSIYKYYGVESK